MINFEKFNIDFKKHSEITHYSNKGTFVDNAEAVTKGKFVTDEHDSINQGKTKDKFENKFDENINNENEVGRVEFSNQSFATKTVLKRY